MTLKIQVLAWDRHKQVTGLYIVLNYQYILQVKQWITFHDPYTFAYGGYGRKDMAPGINGLAKTVYKAATNVLQSHAATFRLYKKRYEAAQKG